MAKWRTEIKDGILIVGDAPGGNYREKALQQARQHLETEPEPDVYHMDIYHDDWCSIWSGGKCDCQPDIVVRLHPFGDPSEERLR